MTEIRPAAVHDLPGAYRVCLQTGDAGEDATSLFRDPDLLGHVYVGPYIVGEPEFALVVADEKGIAGYCLAAHDTRAFGEWRERHWWPRLRTAYPRDAVDDGTPDAEIVALIHDPPVTAPKIVEEYPAHLHIDLLERVRGGGLGRLLIERQLQQLAAAGVAGCHLDVAARNTNAIAFYRHIGWNMLRESAEAGVMGIRLL